jgi:hypothetical protein
MIKLGKSCCLSSAQAVFNYTPFLLVPGVQKKKTGYQGTAGIHGEAAPRAFQGDLDSCFLI